MSPPRLLRRQLVKQGEVQETQRVLHHLLWKIVVENGSKIKVPCSNLRDVPVNAALKVDYDAKKDEITVTAASVNKSGLVAPGIISGV